MSFNDYLRITRDAKFISSSDSNPVVLQLPQGLYGVVSKEGEIIVPFGKYDLIEWFCYGIARVKHGKQTNGVKNSGSKWGIIDTEGNELLPAVFDNIWNFKNGSYDTLRLEKDNQSYVISIEDVKNGKAKIQ